jgi:hypothetical protein
MRMTTTTRKKLSLHEEEAVFTREIRGGSAQHARKSKEEEAVFICDSITN